VSAAVERGSSDAPSYRLVAPAKLTVSLRITGTRPDGYHLIDAEMVSLDLVDELTLHERDEFGDDGLEIVLFAEAMGSRGFAVEAGDDNLVRKALAVANRRAHVRLAKRIPAGAGLGGGSSDAAAVLRWAGVTDLVAAARLGADVAFCLVGGRARVRGIGEIVEPLPFEPRTYTLLTPPFGCSTPAVYRRYDELGGPRGDRGNDLEPAALAVRPELARWRDQLGDASGQTPRLAGSGSTWFVEGTHRGKGHRVVHTMPAPEALT
jgi:4-diphosphocytidyl-2-C-methyl-D-erythritol kinase